MNSVMLIGAFSFAGAGALTDVTTGRIPNWLTGSGLLSGLLLQWHVGGWPGVRSGAEGALLGGGLFFLMFLVGGMGAGDLKLMAAVGAWVGAERTWTVVLITALAGGALAVGYVIHVKQTSRTLRNVVELVRFHIAAGLRPHPELNLQTSPSLRLPYGPAIAVGTLYLVLQHFWG